MAFYYKILLFFKLKGSSVSDNSDKYERTELFAIFVPIINC